MYALLSSFGSRLIINRQCIRAIILSTGRFGVSDLCGGAGG